MIYLIMECSSQTKAFENDLNNFDCIRNRKTCQIVHHVP